MLPVILLRTTCSDYHHLLDVSDFLEMISCHNLHKSAGVDGIPPLLLRGCSFALAPSLAVLFNRPIKESCVPDCWKWPVITPVPKKGDLSLPIGYLPPIPGGSVIPLDRLNLFVARLSTKDYISPYTDILARLQMQPVLLNFYLSIFILPFERYTLATSS